jgi:hypothetical protein
MTTSGRSWKITSQKLETMADFDNGGFSQQWNIGYLVHEGPAEGVKGEIHVPANQLSPEIVSQAIDKLVEKHHRIADL